MLFLKKTERFLTGFICLVFVFFIIFFLSSPARASNLYQAYDLINSSHPATSTNHSLNFITAQAVPAGGKIIINFQNNGLNLPGGFDYGDLDLAIATSGADIFIDRPLAAVADAVNDGAAITGGLGGKITITLNSTAGVGAREKARIKMGTNAEYGGAGDTKIINAAAAGVYWLDIETYNATNVLIDHVRTFVIMIDPVAVSAVSPKMRGNGMPSGTLTADTIMTIMSLTTNYGAVCRFDTASGTDYYSMSDEFFTSDNIYHTSLLTGLMSAHCYKHYVRCYDNEEYTVNADDYLIYFCIAAQGEGGEGGGTGQGEGEGEGGGQQGGGSGQTGGGGGGGSGGGLGGGVGNLKPFPILQNQLPSVALSGWAYPGSLVTALKDGKRVAEVSAKGDATFIVTASDLVKGLYTFSLIAQDTDKIKSIAYPTTFWIEENTQTNVDNIILPPTIKLASSSIPLGSNIIVSGQSIPNQLVSVEFNSPGGQKLIAKNTEKVFPDGRWNSLFTTKGLVKGIYELRAKTVHANFGPSVYSEKLRCGLGEKLDQGPCARSDINKDGKINLVDFSILMYYWGTDNASADLNSDGKVSLVDFSILMYCWTG